ncbi:MAG: hypothetical protein ACRYG4_01600 [Janthinobacterium lividum]
MPIALLALILAAPIAASPPMPPQQPQITITGHRLSDYRIALDQCLTAKCPPLQDIIASVRYAEALFKSGDYAGSRAVLSKSVARNQGAGAIEPAALSQLYVAQATVAAHFGEQRDVEHATFASARVTHDFMAPGTPDRLWADLRVADYRLANERFGGDEAFAKVAADARAAGHPQIAAAADLHRAWGLHAHRRDAEADRILAALAATPGDAARPYRIAARVLTSRIARARGDKGATDAMIAALQGDPDVGAPTLVYSPPYPQPTDPVIYNPFVIATDVTTQSGDVRGLQWVDIGFGIKDDGTVETPEVLRGSRTADWAGPLVKMIAGRRYTPSAASDDTGHYRVERYTLTADFATPVGSLIRRRVSVPRYEQLDLTDGNAPPHAPS